VAECKKFIPSVSSEFDALQKKEQTLQQSEKSSSEVI